MKNQTDIPALFTVVAVFFSSVLLKCQTPAAAFKSEEYLLMGDGMRGGGEPQIAVNPLNPKNIVVTSMANLHRIGETVPLGRGGDGGAADPTSPTGIFYRTPKATICQAAVTQDGGIIWAVVELPLLHDRYIRCSDVIAAVGPDGTFYAGGEPLSAPMPAVGRPGEIRRDSLVSYVYSTDGGKTRSPRVEVMGFDSIRNNRFAPGLKPSINGLPSDRPWVEVNESTGNVYVTARGAVEDRPGAQQRWVLASHDRGRTFGLLYAMDSREYPSKSGQGAIAASHGILAAAYFSDAVPAGAPGKCPCLIFEVSRDDGKTWERRQVQDSGSMSPSGLNIFVVADDTKPGRYSIMAPTANSAAIAVVTTEDFGKNWTAPVIAGSTPGATISKPWVRYSPKGDLAVMWRGILPDMSFRVWAALSKDGGRKFSTPVQVTHASSPPPSRERGAFLFGDDLSGLAADASAVHVVWADSRAGFQGTWYGRVPISMFEFPGN